LSKQAVLRAYQQVQLSAVIDSPSEFFDFHTGEAKLIFGGLICDPTPESVFSCYGTNIFSVKPGEETEPGKINAVFTDDQGDLAFEIVDNEWIGPTSSFDLDIVGQRFTVRSSKGRIALKLRHEPPGKVVIERLDMQYEDIHLLASEYDFALGKYNGHNRNLIWLHVKARIDQIFSRPVAVEINRIDMPRTQYPSGFSAQHPGLIVNQVGKPEYALATDQKLLRLYDPTQCGLHWPALGFQIAKGCEFAVSAVVVGVCSIEHARKNFFSKNRMNVPQLYLPAQINEANLEKEQARAKRNKQSEGKKYLKEPFLVLKDAKAIKKWKKRQNLKRNPQNLITTPFLDDKPGCYNAWGSIKLVDSHDRPAIRLRKSS
jgi:hypothetical protein